MMRFLKDVFGKRTTRNSFSHFCMGPVYNNNNNNTSCCYDALIITVFFILWQWSFKHFTMKWHGSLLLLLLLYAGVKPLCTYLLFLVLCYQSEAQSCFNTKLDGVFVCVFMIYTYTYIIGHSWNYFHSGFSPCIFLFAQSFYSYLDDNHSRCFTLLLVSFISHLLHIYKSSKINKDCTW